MGLYAGSHGRHDGGTHPRYAGLAALPRAQNIQHTVRYTELSPDRFRDFWKD
jgi:hypothetical protein